MIVLLFILGFRTCNKHFWSSDWKYEHGLQYKIVVESKLYGS
jgi:hypothetical protein